MIVREGISLASLTTFRVGGPARYVIECENHEVGEALAFARKQNLPWRVLGSGSNVLADDAGFVGVIIRLISSACDFIEHDGRTLVTVEAGMIWDDLVKGAADRSLWGIENLAGIPGTVGAAPMQNIGAYGSDVSDTLEWVEVLDTVTGELRRHTKDACGFGYRDSRFKHEPHLIVLRAAFSLTDTSTPNLSYKDLAVLKERGEMLATPEAVGEAVRRIRAVKFPDLSVCGTAGSFFKNPIITEAQAAELRVQYPELPCFSAGEGKTKVALAWILDHVLHLNGYREGHVRAFEVQPLVIVTEDGATAKSVDAFANEIASRVCDATGITIEREVQRM